MKRNAALPPVRVVAVRRDPDAAMRLVDVMRRCGVHAIVVATDDAARDLDHAIAIREQRAWQAARARTQRRT